MTPTDPDAPPPDSATTEGILEASRDLDLREPAELVDIFCEEEARVREAFDARARATLAALIDAAHRSLEAGGRIIYLGAGTSGRLGVLDASECPPTFGVDPGRVIGLIAGGERALRESVEGAEDSIEDGARAVGELEVGPVDLVIGIAASGTTPYVWGGLAEARRREARTGLITCNRLEERRDGVDHLLEIVTGPEVISGSTRLKAGSATKIALNTISSGAMVRWGKVYGNLMVDVRAVNRKLRLRAERLVVRLAGVEPGSARDALERSDWEVKTAVVSLIRRAEPRRARELLDRAGGSLRRALEGQESGSREA